MNRKTFQFAIWLLWLALPLTALRFWLVWDRLPQRMATHFDASWHANGWMPRQDALYFALGITAFMLVVFTVIAYAAHRSTANGSVGWVMLGFFYVVIAFLFAINDMVIAYNLGNPVSSGNWLLAAIPLAAFVFVASYLRLNRGKPLPSAQPIAEETHSSNLFGLLFLVASVGFILLLAMLPANGARVVNVALGFLFFVIAASAWSGFQYFFTPYGVEIHTLGYRLRSIPLKNIVSYQEGTWNPLRGYGIRGLGGSCAYVWGNRVVRIHTTEGDVILGHSDPDRIVRDLDRIRQSAH